MSESEWKMARPQGGLRGREMRRNVLVRWRKTGREWSEMDRKGWKYKKRHEEMTAESLVKIDVIKRERLREKEKE